MTVKPLFLLPLMFLSQVLLAAPNSPGWRTKTPFIDVISPTQDYLAGRRLNDAEVCADALAGDIRGIPDISSEYVNPQDIRQMALDDLEAANQLAGLLQKVPVTSIEPDTMISIDGYRFRRNWKRQSIRIEKGSGSQSFFWNIGVHYNPTTGEIIGYSHRESNGTVADLVAAISAISDHFPCMEGDGPS